MVDSNNDELFYQSIVRLIDNVDFRTKLGENLYVTVVHNNSEEQVINKYLDWIKIYKMNQLEKRYIFLILIHIAIGVALFYVPFFLKFIVILFCLGEFIMCLILKIKIMRFY